MVNISFWTNSKKRNSTSYPDVSTRQGYANGYLRDGCSIINPVIEFAPLSSITINLWHATYAYIQQFERYYFIDDWTYEAGLWIATMSVDVLGTYATPIKSSYQYVTRSSSNKDSKVIDSMYLTKAKSTVSIDTFPTNDFKFGGNTVNYQDDIWNQSLDDGVYVIGVTGLDADEGGIEYYQIDGGEYGMVKLITGLYGINPTDYGSIGNGLAKQIANPIQYIASCYWYPYSVIPNPVYTDTVTIPLGYYKVQNIRAIAIDASLVTNYANGGVITLPTHPQASTVGDYLNYSPYAKYDLMMNPFGTIQLEPTLIVPGGSIKVDFRNDVTNGEAELLIKAKSSASSSTYDIVAYKGKAQTGMSVSLMSKTTDLIGTVSGLAGTVANLATGNFLGAAGSLVSAVGSDLSQKTTGNAAIGGILSWEQNPHLQSQFFEIAFNTSGTATPNELVGSPLCEYRQLSGLTGYCQCSNASLPTWTLTDRHATVQERDAIISYLNNGIYLES